MRTGRVLVMDDEERWREAVAETLRSGGLQVDTAATRQDAAEKLVSGFYHLLVIDIRMDEQDQANEDGMKLLRELDGLQGGLATIVLSAYGRMDQMREAFGRLYVVDFIDKKSFDDV